MEASIYADYIGNNLGQVNLGSWQSYINSISRQSLLNTLHNFSVEFDKVNSFVPEEEFGNIREALMRASKIQMEVGKSRHAKLDTEHDAKLYYHIDLVRNRQQYDAASFAYDTYLLTLDGSLAQFVRLYNIPFSKTYFIYPNQWYELAFPFLRIRTSENPNFAAGLASAVFSNAFPDLRALLPLELCSYVFESGATDLSMVSVRNFVEGLVEKKLVEVLDPTNEDKRAREEAKLRVQRMVAEEQLKTSKKVQELESRASSLERKTEVLKDEHSLLETDVENLRTTKEVLNNEVAEKKVDMERYGGFDVKLAAIKSQYEEQIVDIEAENAIERETLQQKLEEEKKTELAILESKLVSMNNVVNDIKRQLEENQEEKVQVERKRANNIRILQKSVITVLMTFGLLLSLAFLINSTLIFW